MDAPVSSNYLLSEAGSIDKGLEMYGSYSNPMKILGHRLCDSIGKGAAI